jgi:YVTN family beta-propeller protein
MNELDWSISIIDTNEIKLLKSFHLPFIPYELVISNKTGYLYIVSDKQNALYLVNSQTEQIEKLFDIEHPCGIGINQQTNTIYASSETNDLVYVLDGNKNALTDKIKVGSGPRGITVNENNNTVYVANSKSNSLSLISGDTNMVEKEIKTEEDPRRLVHDNLHNFIYSINLEPGLVNIINPKGVLLNSFKIDTPNDLGYNSKTDTLYMTNHYENIFYIENISDLTEHSRPLENSCLKGFELVYKASNHMPACVFSDSVQKLIERGWAKTR